MTCGKEPLGGIKKDLFSQHLVHKLNNHGSFAHCRGDTFPCLSPDVANRENSGKARFKQIRGPVQRPAVLNLRTGLMKPFASRGVDYLEAIPVLGLVPVIMKTPTDVAGFCSLQFRCCAAEPSSGECRLQALRLWSKP